MNIFRLASGICIFAAAISVLKAEPPAAKEDLGYDVFGGKTNKIDRVVLADPRSVWVVYEGDKGNRRIPRTNLPPQLSAKYPYDAQKAAEYTETKVKENQTQLAIQKQGLQIREHDLISQIAVLKKRQADNEAEIKNLNRQIKATPKKSRTATDRDAKINLLKEQDDLRQHIEKLEDTLKQVQAQLAALP